MVNTTAFLNTVKAGVRTTVLAEGTYVAVGTGSTAADVSDTTLGVEEERNARQEYTEGTSDVIISGFITSVQCTGDDLTEVGVLDAAASGDLMMREVFTTISKTSSIEIWIDIEQQIDVTQ